MPGDRVASTFAESPTQPDHKDEASGWFTDNVLHPFVNGTGVRQIADTFTGTDYKPLYTAPEEGIVSTATQTVSSVVGSIAPYIVLGKLAHKGLGNFAESRSITGVAGKILRSEPIANVGAAGAYEFLKKPGEGQTRIGNSAGTMLSFAAYEGGNYGLGKVAPVIKNRIAAVAVIGTGRALIGGVGGELQYDASNLIAGYTGGENRANSQGRMEAIASGVVMNEALPLVSSGAGKLIKSVFGSAKPEPMKITINLSKQAEGPALADKPLMQAAEANLAPGVVSAAKPVVEVVARSQTPMQLIKADVATTDIQAVSAMPGLRARALSAVDGLGQTFSRLKESTSALLLGRDVPQKGYAFNGSHDIPNEGAPPAGEGAHPAATHESANAPGSELLPRMVITDESGQHAIESGAGPATERAAKARSETRPGETSEKAREEVSQPIDPAHFGKPEVGATFTPDGINFGLHSPDATKVELLVYSSPDAKEPSQVLPLYKTGDVWHRVDNLPEFTTYQYRVSGPNTPEVNGTRFDNTQMLLDPEARAVYRTKEGDNNVNDARAIAVRSDFDWQGVKRPGTLMEDTIIYEMNVRGFTAGDASLGDMRGTYRGLMAKIPYLKELGVTAIELMPVMEFQKEMKLNPETGKMLMNAWGYQTVGFKAVEGSYAHDGAVGQQVAEFKEMVRELHRNGIEVIMDVVFNHTGEGGADGKTVNFRGINNNQMYILDKDNKFQYVDKTGCGNTVNANDPAVMDFIIKSLRYWVEEMHVDGFRFDLAKALKYMPDGSFNDTAPLIKAIKADPVLSQVKLFAEPWDMSGYGPGRFSEGWAEWNGKFRDVVRRFVKGLTGQVKELGDLIAGSANAGFDPEKGMRSTNFVTVHDGFTMNDLVSYDNKHNESNGENNRDGANDNDSRNYGVEGPVEKNSPIDILRARQIKNFMSWLFFSEGTPLLLSGDEMRRTQDGNNNPYNQPDLNEVNWNLLTENAGVFNFAKKAIELHKALKIGHMKPSDIIWHGTKPNAPDWGDGARFIARQFKAVGDQNKTVYVAANSWEGPVDIELPPGKWHRIIDTNMPEFSDIKPVNEGDLMDSPHYRVMPYTTVAFVQDVPAGTSRPITIRPIDGRNQQQNLHVPMLQPGVTGSGNGSGTNGSN